MFGLVSGGIGGSFTWIIIAVVLAMGYGAVQTLKNYGYVEYEAENLRKVAIYQKQEAKKYRNRVGDLLDRDSSARKEVDGLKVVLGQLSKPKPINKYCRPGCTVNRKKKKDDGGFLDRIKKLGGI